MKATIIMLLSLVGAAVTQTPTRTFSKANGTRFNIDGVTKYYTGSNNYWLAFQMQNSDIDLVLDHFVASGLKVFRM